MRYSGRQRIITGRASTRLPWLRLEPFPEGVAEAIRAAGGTYEMGFYTSCIGEKGWVAIPPRVGVFQQDEELFGSDALLVALNRAVENV